MLRARGAGREFTMETGEWRSLPEHALAVGRHVPPASDRIPDFMQYFADRYRLDRLGKAGRIIAMAAAHHRFNYIRPFPDGNGRVSRLMSHAMAWKRVSGRVVSGPFPAVWRGLASRTEYGSCASPSIR